MVSLLTGHFIEIFTFFIINYKEIYETLQKITGETQQKQNEQKPNMQKIMNK